MKQLIFFTVLFFSATLFSQEIILHKVKPRETIYGIAKMYKLKVNDIYNANPNVKAQSLQIGQVLNVPNYRALNSEKPKAYTVKKGDSFYAIAKKNNIKVRQLIEANPTVDPNRIKPGMKLNLVKISKQKPVTIEEEIAEEEQLDNMEDAVYQDVIHVVKKGQTLYSIAKEYGISVDSLQSLNPNLQATLPANYQLLIKKGIPIEEEPIEVVVEVEDSTAEETSDIPTYESLEKTEMIINSAKGFLGTRYRYGGRSTSGIDCSGLVCESYNSAGISVPRTSSAQATSYKKVKKKKAKPGDLIFFITRGKRISHVGIITEILDDNIKFIHASSSSGVIISSLNESYYSRRFAQISRVLN